MSKEKNEKNFHSIETQYGTFTRSFSLPDNVDANGIKAKYENGILEISIPKDEKNLPELLADKKFPGKTCAYICQGTSCQPVIEDIQELKTKTTVV